MTNKSPFNTAITEDMERLALNDRQLGMRMGITQQAVFRWRTRGFPPATRVAELIQILGADSKVAELTPTEMFGPSAPDTPVNTHRPLQLGALGSDPQPSATFFEASGAPREEATMRARVSAKKYNSTGVAPR